MHRKEITVLKKICLHCQKSFTTKPRFPQQKYCKAKCRNLAISKRYRAKFAKPIQTRVCPTCHTEFTPDKLHPYKRYCSRRCSYKPWYKKRYTNNVLFRVVKRNRSRVYQLSKFGKAVHHKANKKYRTTSKGKDERLC